MLLALLPSVDQILAVTAAAAVVILTCICLLLMTEPASDGAQLQHSHHKLGLEDAQSNLSSQYAPVHHAQKGRQPTVQSLHIYPLKSCRGIELAQSRLLASGLEFDRLYTFAQLRAPEGKDAEREPAGDPVWHFATQRQLPLLANVKVDVWLGNDAGQEAEDGAGRKGVIVVRFPWTDKGTLRGLYQTAASKVRHGLHSVPEKRFTLPLEFPSDDQIKTSCYPFATVKIWNETTNALSFEQALPKELQTYLGGKHRLALFRMDPRRQREVFRCAPREAETGMTPVVDFHDAYPLHMLSLSSTQDFSAKVQKDLTLQRLDIRRFRANIIISGADPYDEETWRSFQCSRPGHPDDSCLMDVSCRTVRCQMPNVDPENGIRHRKEPDYSLRKHRDVDEGAPRLGCLGMQLCPLFPVTDAKKHRLRGFIEVGMDIDVLSRGSHIYIPQ